MSYGCILWGNSLKKFTKPVTIMQKKSIRLVANAQYNAHCNPLFEQLKVLPLHQLLLLQTNQLMHQLVNGSLSLGLTSFFDTLTNQSTHNTRFSVLFTPPQTQLSFVHRSFLFLGPQQWHILPSSLISTIRYSTLTKQLKRHLTVKI